MGIKLIFLAILSCILIIKPNNGKFKKKQKIEIIKEFVLCDCLMKNYHKIDTSIALNDISLSVYMNEYNFINFESAKLIDSLITELNILIERPNSHTQSVVPNSNQIFIDCIRFTNSKRLENEIKNKILK
jgi:hypothetical protein